MDTFQTRIVAAILLLVLTFVVGFVPPYVFEYFARRARARKLARRKARSIARFHTPRTVAGDTASDQISEGDDDSTGHVIKRRSRSNSICSTDSIASRANLSSTKILQAFMFFGGGVLLATCFCHLIPEARENFNSYMKKHGGPLETAHVHSHTPMPSHLHDPNDGHIETGLSRLRPNATSAVLYAEDGTIDGHNHPSASDRDLITANPPINHSPSGLSNFFDIFFP